MSGSLLAAMYDDYSTKLTAAYYVLDCISIASSHTYQYGTQLP